MEDEGTVAIAVATYKRPKLLADLLNSLQVTEPSPSFRVIVVDNDPAGSAREVCESSSLDLEYAVEPSPGIAAARNCGLRHIREDDAFIVFVDDDERVMPNWLNALLRTARKYDADVVSGPVISVFAPDVSKWILRGGFIQRARFATGDEVRSPATNNTLVRLSFLRAAGFPMFDETYSLTGGSDTEFFRRLTRHAPRMIWCDEAVVEEDVPSARANFRWIWKRGIREGNVSGRLRLLQVGRPRLIVDGLARVALGSVRQLAEFLTGRGLQAKSVAYITRGIGWIGAGINLLVVEYARKPQKANVPS